MKRPTFTVSPPAQTVYRVIGPSSGESVAAARAALDAVRAAREKRAKHD